MVHACPNCRWYTDINDATCPHCGQPMPEPDPTLLEIEEPVSPFWRVWESGQLVLGAIFLIGLFIWVYRQYNGEVMAGLGWVETAVSALITWLTNAPFFSNILLLSLFFWFLLWLINKIGR
ncbi:MAG: hypothetical protein KDE56_26515 [Anaerolineales bacterium]|nr:hypothetical protein [Anaerolineales bacterium]